MAPPVDGKLEERGEPPAADARVLGQLLAAQNLLPVLPTSERIAGFYARALTSIPGVGECRVCLADGTSEGPRPAESCAECERRRAESGGAPDAGPFACVSPTLPGWNAIPFATQQQHFGYFVLRLSDPAAFEPYRPFVHNLGLALALSLENRRQREGLVSARDALERRVEERTEELRRALAESDDLYQNAPCGYHSLGQDGLYLRVNDTELRWLGRARDEVVGRLRFPDLLAPPSRELFLRSFAALQAHGAMHDVELVLLRKDGAELPVLLSATAIRDPEGRFLRSRSTMYDLSEHRRTEAALRESEDRFRQSQKLEAVGRLAGGVAHDFNNLLTVILSCSGSLLELLPLADPRRADAEDIADAARKAAQLTRQLLAFGRRQASAPVALDVGEVVAGMESLLRRLIGEDVKLEFTRSPTAGRVRADAGQLEQVVLNLVVNARDAMPGGGRIRVETGALDLTAAGEEARRGAAPARYVTLTVRDEGTGMTAETRSHLFEPFFTTKAKGKGTGLGLATVYGIVKQAGGDVRVESAPGQGSTFEVLLPALTGAPAEVSAAPTEDAPRRGSETVLLVEDDERVRTATARALRAAGYTVVEAEDGEAALERLAAAPTVDVLVTDVVMPRLGGPALAARLRTLRPGVRVLFVSGYAEEGLLQGEVRGGAEILWKPFTTAALAQAVRALVDGPGAGQAAGG
jgi:PAS domain S-box-containing protein